MALGEVKWRVGKKKRSVGRCGWGGWRPECLQWATRVEVFVLLMCLIIAVQGTYLGYTVSVLTNIERRFEISSRSSGTLLSLYDVGHTLAVVLVGHFGGHNHKPRWTGAGVVLSCLAMVGLSLPNFIFGAASEFEIELVEHHDRYVAKEQCQPSRDVSKLDGDGCEASLESRGAYAIFALSQLLAGIGAAPFNTLAYIYIDENVEPRRSPFFLGLLTSMYAFGPALGFALGAGSLSLYAEPLSSIPPDLTRDSPNWVGAWWLGFLVCAVLYLLLAPLLFAFPRSLPSAPRLPHHYSQHYQDMVKLHQEGAEMDPDQDWEPPGLCRRLLDSARELPPGILALIKNPVYVCMVMGWVFGSYLVGGFGTYLPKYVETQFGQSAALADLYAGLISIGSVAVSTALGGALLTKLNIHPHKATFLLVISWSLLLLTYLVGMGTGCQQPTLEGQPLPSATAWNYYNACNAECRCDGVRDFDPVCDGNGTTHFSPCHAGCTYDEQKQIWDHCICAPPPNDPQHIASRDGHVQPGWCPLNCSNLPVYVAIMFVGLFLGNLFFMTTMMVVLRSVEDDLKALALSMASCVTNVLGFIPAPVIFGAVVDSSCLVWHSLCEGHKGGCILYDAQTLRHRFHLSNAGFQLLAVVGALGAALFPFWKGFTFPEDRPPDDDEEWDDSV